MDENVKQVYYNTKYCKQQTCIPQVWALEIRDRRKFKRQASVRRIHSW